MIRSVLNLNTIDLRAPAENIFVARFGLAEAVYPTPESRSRFADELLVRLQTLPGAQTVALTSHLPGRGGASSSVAIEGQTRDDGSALAAAMVPIVSPGYFQIFDAPPMRGRNFTPADVAGSEWVAIVNRAFEQRYFPDGSALTRRIRIGNPEAPWLTIVGVVPDLLESGVNNWRPEAVYRPLAQQPLRTLSVVVRTSASPLALTAEVRDHVRAIDPDLPIFDVNTLRGAVQDANFTTGIFGGLFAAFGSAALLLASVGLYGVMSFSVGQRRRELGVRLAVGARPRALLALVLRDGMRQVTIGLIFGALLAFALSRAIASALFGITPNDPLAIAGTVVILVAVALLACAVPALRATRIDPLDALRSE
jgi:predicted permease